MMQEEKSSTRKTKLPKVEVVVPTYGGQPAEWWREIMINLLAEHKTTVHITAVTTSYGMLPDDNKNKVVEKSIEGQLLHTQHRKHLTDINRNLLTQRFMDPKNDPDNPDKEGADYLCFIDADTVPPKGFLGHLIGLKREIVSGLYFLSSEPYNPVAYHRRSDGLYSAFYGYTLGQLLEVDSIGMGCAVIHRSVFQKYQEEFTVYMRKDTAALIPVHNESIKNKNKHTGKSNEPFVSNGVLNIPVEPVDWEKEDSAYPFFALEYGRTEDHFFCENVKKAGFKIYLDTTVVCDHLKTKATTQETYQEKKAQFKDVLERRVRSHG